MHLFEPARVIYYKIVSLPVYLTMKHDFNRLMNDIKKTKPKPNVETIVFTGILSTPQKPTLLRFIRKIAENLNETNVVLLDETPKRSSILRKPINMTYFRVPRAIAGGAYDTTPRFHAGNEITDVIEQKEFLTNAARNLKCKQSNIDKRYASALVYFYYRMYQTLLEVVQPRFMVIWSQFPALHQVCAQVCQEQGVKVLYMEYGSLPGTFALDSYGQMGESWPAVKYEDFLALPVDDQQLYKTREVLDYLKKSKINRNVQPENDELTQLKEKLQPGKPLVLFAGQSDFDSGFYPYSDHVRKFHSPIFPYSWTAMKYLAEIAKENDWELIFKPHPQMSRQTLQRRMPANVHLVTSVDLNELIDMVDLVVTIVSQTSYITLIRERPIVMLGYNQLRGKGCVYEAFEKDDIQTVISAAIENRYTPAQREAFIRHTAQMLSYSLYDDMTERPLRFGQDIDKAVAFFRDELQ